MQTIQSSTDNKQAQKEIALHMEANPEVTRGKKQADVLLVISREVYDLVSSNVPYKLKIIFAMQCDSNSMTQLFVVQRKEK